MVNSAKILLVEDEGVWRRRLQKILEREGYKVETAISYGEALGRLYRGSFNLIVTDLRLGPEEPPRDFEGMALLEDACERGIPTIVVTGYPKVELARRAYKDFDVEQFIEKHSFGAERFKETVRQALMPTVPRAAAFLFNQGIIEAIPDDLAKAVDAEVSKIIEERVLALLRQLRVHESSLHKLEVQKAAYGISVPLYIQNDIEYVRDEIRKKGEQLKKLLEEISRRPMK